MTTLNVSFVWDTGAQYSAWTATPGASVTLSNATGGDGGTTCLSAARAVKGNSGADSTWTLTTTWAALGVPTGHTVTGVTSASSKSKCTVFTSAGTGNTAGAITVADGATTITLASQRSITATDANFVTTNGVDSTGLALAAGNSITFTVRVHNQNANSTGSSVTILQDTLAFTITYELRGALNSTEAADTVSGAATVDVSGSLNSTEGADTLSGAAGVLVEGNLNSTEAADTLSASAGVIVAASLNTTEAPDTLSASGTVSGGGGGGITGSLSSTEDADSLSATGGIPAHVFQCDVFQHDVFQGFCVVSSHVFQCNVFQHNVFQGICGAFINGNLAALETGSDLACFRPPYAEAAGRYEPVNILRRTIVRQSN